MDAIILNQSILRVQQWAQESLLPLGFTVGEAPEPQEDSGDLVSSESMSFCFFHLNLQIEMRVFLCCGKGSIEDYIHVKFVDSRENTLFVDVARLSERRGLSLHLIDFNFNKQPMSQFLEAYLADLRQALPDLVNDAKNEFLEKRSVHNPEIFKIFSI